MPGRLHVPDAAPLLDRGEKRNSWRCGGCCAHRPAALVLVRWRCRGPPPVPVLSPWLPSVAPGSPGGGGRGVQCRAPGAASSAASGFSVATARSSNVFRCGRQDVAVPLGFAVLSVLWWLPPGGVAEHHHLLFLQHTGDRSSRPATPAT